MPMGRLEYPFYFNTLYSVVLGKFFFAAQQIPVNPGRCFRKRQDIPRDAFLCSPPILDGGRHKAPDKRRY
jgi:hypothetical protein